MKREYLSWCAGFYEGEGTAGFYKEVKRGTSRLVVGVTQKEPDVLVEMIKYFDCGSLSHIRKGKIGEVWVLHLSGHSAVYFLSKIIPFMRSPRKIAQAQTALDSWNKRPIKKGSPNEKRIKAINK